MTKHVATCHTEGCENAGVGITFLNPAQVIICGPCGRQIEDIAPPIPDPEPETTPAE